MSDTLRSQLEVLARQRPVARTADDVAAERAWRAGRRRWATAPLAAAAVAFSLVALAALAGAAPLARPRPAQPAVGQGALPSRIVLPPVGTPLVTEQPMERAAYVIATGDLRRGAFSRGVAPVVVSADGGAYRIVPWHDGDHGISLSPDGRRLAWVVGDVPLDVTRTVVLTLATGELREVPGAPTAADGTAWSDDGTRLLVWGSRRVSDNTTQDAAVQVHDARTLALVRSEPGFGPAAMVGGQVVVPTMAGSASTGVLNTGRAVLSPDGREAAEIDMPGIDGGLRNHARLVVHPAGTAPGDFTPVLELREVAYAEVLAWTAEGVVVAEYAGSHAPGPAQVVVLDPGSGSVVRGLTRLPADAGQDFVVDVNPQVVAVATQVLQGGQIADTRPRAWPWHSLERLRWWASDPVRAGLQAGLGPLALLVVVLLVRMARRR